MKYRRKLSEEVEAVQWTGTNLAEVEAFFGFGAVHKFSGDILIFEAPGGLMPVVAGDYIIKDELCEIFRTLRSDAFERNYEPVEEQK